MYLFPLATPPAQDGAIVARALDAEAGRVVGANTVLFREGDRAEALFEVVSGVFRATKFFADGRRQIVAFAYPGDIIGFGHGQTYRFDCDALTPGRLRVIGSGELGEAMRDRPDFATRLLGMAAGEVATMQDLFILLCRKTAMERVAGFLLSLAARTGKEADDQRIALPMCRADIADHLGITIETVSRNLTKLRTRGIVDLPARDCFVIRDLDRLRQEAECDAALH